jgi:hypothetical protein
MMSKVVILYFDDVSVSIHSGESAYTTIKVSDSDHEIALTLEPEEVMELIKQLSLEFI